MSRRVHDQPDLFGDAPSPDLFAGDEPPPPTRRVDLDTIRRRLERILAEACAAERMPWNLPKQEVYRSLFPEMAALLRSMPPRRGGTDDLRGTCSELFQAQDGLVSLLLGLKPYLTGQELEHPLLVIAQTDREKLANLLQGEGDGDQD